jgi:hypothetical protein
MTPFSFLIGATFAGGSLSTVFCVQWGGKLFQTQYLILQKFINLLQFLAKIIYQYLIVQKNLIFGMDDSPLVQCQVEHEEYFRDIRADSKISSEPTRVCLQRGREDAFGKSRKARFWTARPSRGVWGRFLVENQRKMENFWPLPAKTSQIVIIM